MQTTMPQQFFPEMELIVQLMKSYIMWPAPGRTTIYVYKIIISSVEKTMAKLI